MKNKTQSRFLGSLFGLIAMVFILSGCGSEAAPTIQNALSPTAQPTALAAQSRIVIAEMFTGDW